MIPDLSIVIAYYQNPQFLKAILDAFQNQTHKNFELIVAEDDDELRKLDLLEDYQNTLRIKHVFQKDIGFRKCKILNEAIQVSASDFIVFIDGDCIPHPHFAREYFKMRKYNCVFGRRVMLSEQLTTKVLNQKKNPSLVDLILSNSKDIKHAIYWSGAKPALARDKGIWGCNWAVSKELLYRVNGFDEDYEHAGIGEDVDIEWRLRGLGVSIFYSKHRAIVYHLYHQKNYGNSDVSKGYELLAQKQEAGKSFCSNGLVKV